MKFLIGLLLTLSLSSCTRNQESVPQGQDIKKYLTVSKTVSGLALSAAALEGKVTIVNFWASWCPPCQEETPSLLKLVNRHQDQFILISVSEDASLQDMQKFMNLFPSSKSRNVFLIHDPKRIWSQGYGVYQFPETFVYDGKMNLIKKFIGAIPFQDSAIESYFLNLATAKK